MKKGVFNLVFLITALIVNTQCIFAQKYVEENSKFFERVYFGGNFGAQFGTFTHIEASPIVGYMVNPKLSVGLGVIYQYFRDRGSNPIGDYETNIYGGKLFSRYNFTNQIFAYTEYENINLDVIINSVQGFDFIRAWVPAYFIGGGYFQPLGNRAGVNMMLLYNVLYNPNRSPYNSAFVLRVGFTL